MEEYSLNKQETALQAKELLDKGKAVFFVRDTLLKRGANPEDVKEIIQEITDHKNKIARRDKLLGLCLFIGGIVWIWAIYHFDGLHELVMGLRRSWSRTVVTFGPFAAGVLYLIKGTFKLTKLF